MLRFSNIYEVKKFLLGLKSIGIGSQGEVFKSLDGGLVYKIFHDYEEIEYNEWKSEDILKFSDVGNNTFIFPLDVIMIKNIVIGYITKFVLGKDLCNINPFSVNLNFLIKAISESLDDVKKISDCGVCTYDVMYNIMLGEKISVVDSLDYSRVVFDTLQIYKNNIYNFNMGFMYFLVDNIFDEIVKSNKLLNEMYLTKGKDISIVEFIKAFKYYLSELVGMEVINLGMARMYANKRRKEKVDYIRCC